MNVKFINTIRDIIGMILQFLIIYIIDILIFSRMDYEMNNLYLLPFVMVPLIVLCYLLLRNLKRLPFAVLPLAIFLALIIYIPFDSTAKLVFIAEYAVIVGFFFRNWCSKVFTDNINMPPTSCTLLFLFLQLTSVNRIAYYFGLVFLALSVIEKYIKNMVIYVYNNNDVRKLPLKQITKLNGFYAGIFACISIVALIIGKIVGFDKYMNVLINKFQIYMQGKYLFSDMQFNEIQEDKKDEIITVEEQEEVLNGGDGGFSIFSILVPIIKIFLLIIFVIIVVHFVKKIFKTIKNSYYKGTSNIDRVSYIKIDEDVTMTAVAKPSLFKKRNMNTSEKMRQVYYKKILKVSKRNKEVFANMTPSEITDYAIKKNTEKEKELTSLYEKARYSKDICSENELKKIKEL